MSEKRRIVWIDQLRAVAFYLVMFAHHDINKNLKSWIYSFHMPLFFFISGLNLNFKRMNETSFVSFFTKNFKRIIVPYFWLSMLSLIFSFAVNFISSGKELKVAENLIGILLANTRLAPSPSLPLYFAVILFFAQLGLWCFVKITKGDKVKLGILLCVFALLSALTQKVHLIWHINVVPTGMLLMYIGRLLMELYYSYKEKLQSINKAYYVLFSAVLFIIGYLVSKENGRVSFHYNSYGKDYFVFLLCSLLTSVAVALLVMLIPYNKLLTFIGQNTMLYLGLHFPIICLLEAIFPDYIESPMFIIVCSVLSFLLLAPCAFVANKFFPYINGNSIKKNTFAINVFKYIMTLLALSVPYYYFCSKFMGGILREGTTNQILSAGIYLFVVLVLVISTDKFFPFVFLKEKEKNKD